jgi:hypothetical protein
VFAFTRGSTSNNLHGMTTQHDSHPPWQPARLRRRSRRRTHLALSHCRSLCGQPQKACRTASADPRGHQARRGRQASMALAATPQQVERRWLGVVPVWLFRASPGPSRDRLRLTKPMASSYGTSAVARVALKELNVVDDIRQPRIQIDQEQVRACVHIEGSERVAHARWLCSCVTPRRSEMRPAGASVSMPM